MTFKNIKFWESPVMRELERQELRKNPPKPQPVVKQASAKITLDPNQEFFSQILSLGSLLRQKGFTKEADSLDDKLFLLKQAETHLYRVFDQDGEDLLNFAHPDGDFVAFEAQQDLGKVETLQGVQKAMLEVVKKPATGKQTRSTHDAVVLAAMALGLIKNADGEGEGEGEGDEEVLNTEQEQKKQEKLEKANQAISKYASGTVPVIDDIIAKLNAIKPVTFELLAKNKNYQDFVIKTGAANAFDSKKILNFYNLSVANINNFDDSLMLLIKEVFPQLYTKYTEKESPDSIYPNDLGSEEVSKAQNNIKKLTTEVSQNLKVSLEKFKSVADKAQLQLSAASNNISKELSLIKENLPAKTISNTKEISTLITQANKAKNTLSNLANPNGVAGLWIKPYFYGNIDSDVAVVLSGVTNFLKEISLENDKTGLHSRGEFQATAGKLNALYNSLAKYINVNKDKPSKNLDSAKEAYQKLKVARTAFSSALAEMNAESNKSNEDYQISFSDLKLKDTFPGSPNLQEFNKTIDNWTTGFKQLQVIASKKNISKLAADPMPGAGATAAPGGGPAGGAGKGTGGSGKKNEKVAQMQNLLDILGASNLVTSQQDKLTIRTTGSHGPDATFGDGVWGSHTTNALKAAQQYCKKFGEFKLTPGEDVNGSADYNIQILQKVTGTDGKAGEELDSIALPSRIQFEDGPIKVFSTSIINLYSMASFLQKNDDLTFHPGKDQRYYVKVGDIKNSVNKFVMRWQVVAKTFDSKAQVYGRYIRILQEKLNLFLTKVSENDKDKKFTEPSKELEDITNYIINALKRKILENNRVQLDIVPIYDNKGNNINMDSLLSAQNQTFGFDRISETIGKSNDVNLQEYKRILNSFVEKKVDDNKMVPIELLLVDGQGGPGGVGNPSTMGPGGQPGPGGRQPGQGGPGQGQGGQEDNPDLPPIGNSINIGQNGFWQGTKTHTNFGLKWINIDSFNSHFTDLASSLFSNNSKDVIPSVLETLRINNISTTQQGSNSAWNQNGSWQPVFQMGRGGLEIHPSLYQQYGNLQQLFNNLMNQNVSVKCRNFLLTLRNELPSVANEWKGYIQNNRRFPEDKMEREFAKIDRSVKNWVQTINLRLADVGLAS